MPDLHGCCKSQNKISISMFITFNCDKCYNDNKSLLSMDSGAHRGFGDDSGNGSCIYFFPLPSLLEEKAFLLSLASLVQLPYLSSYS
jgi:hypothetical protein